MSFSSALARVFLSQKVVFTEKLQVWEFVHHLKANARLKLLQTVNLRHCKQFCLKIWVMAAHCVKKVKAHVFCSWVRPIRSFCMKTEGRYFKWGLKVTQHTFSFILLRGGGGVLSRFLVNLILLTAAELIALDTEVLSSSTGVALQRNSSFYSL